MNHTDQHDETTRTNEPITAAQRRVDALRRAARNKRQAATTRAETAIRQLIKSQQEITFRSVARAGGVSLDFLYTNIDLRRRIETLRAQQTTQTPTPSARQPPEDTDSNLVHVLTRKLREERTARRATVDDLEQRLAAAHGELLRLRRAMEQHGVQA